MRINGLMIDCSRLLERPEYYDRLLDFMADWGMNTLLLHFSDDYGCAVRLPGFGHLAMRRAFTPAALTRWLVRAKRRGIDVIPELEAFGHTRYITDHPRHRHLYAGRRQRRLTFNAIDPLHPETYRLMRGLVRAVAAAFPSRYLHLGCDEVNLADYCRGRDLDPDAVWADYVNAVIGYAHDAGKVPMIWGDHPAKSPAIARRLRKDVVLVEWRYEPDVKDTVLPALKRAGFRDFFVAPALGCYRHRFLPVAPALENTRRMTRFGASHRVRGVLNTIWCPWRYLQNAMYYGIAYSADTVRANGRADSAAVDARFARRVFGTPLTPALADFLRAYPRVEVPFTVAQQLAAKELDLNPEQLRQMRRTNAAGRRALAAATAYRPRRNRDIWRGMVLAARCAWLCSESVMLRLGQGTAARRAAYNRLLVDARRALDEEWDRTRFADDPQKRRPRFPNDDDQYALLLMRKLPRL